MIKPKLLYAITKSNWGGAQKYVYDLATSSEIRNRFDVSVLTGGNGELVKKLEEAGIKVYIQKNIKRDINLFSDILGVFELHKIIRNIDPDIIHLNSSKMGFVGAIVSRSLNVKRIVFTSHGWPFNEDRNILVKILFRILCAFIITLTHKTIAVSENVKNSFKKIKYLNNKIQVIYNGVHEHTYAHLPKLSEGSGTKHVVSIGELNSNKNHISVIRILKHVKNIHYHIIGDGEMLKRLEKEIKTQGVKNKVTIHGHVKSAYAILPQFDIFLLPSKTEAFGYVLLEAMLAGLPVISRNVGGVSEVLTGVKSAILYNNDSELINILNTHDKIGEKVINSRFGLKYMTNETKNLYLSLLN